LVYVFRSNDRAEASALIQTVVAVLAVVGPVAVALLNRRRLRAATDVSLDLAADALMGQVRSQREKAAAERRLRHPAPVRVWWEWSKLPVTGPMTDAVRDGGVGFRRFAVLPGMSAVTVSRLRRSSVDDLLAVYGGLDSGRMIILGGPGAGKSGAAIRLLLDAVTHRASLDDDARRVAPVPVLFTVSGWDPTRQSIAEWLASRLTRDYPFLNAGDYGPDAAARLLGSGRITMIIDGLDELPQLLRPAALRTLDAQGTSRLVLLTRSQELVDAVVDGHLSGAAALELLPVSAEDAADYLDRCQIQPLTSAWQRLTDHLRTDPEGVVSRALSTPLMLTLIRDVYRREDPVDKLLDSARFDTSEAIEDDLLDLLLPTAYSARPGDPAPVYDRAQARDWLSYIAYQLDRERRYDLRWWRMLRWKSPAPRILTTSAVLGLTVTLLIALLFDLVVVGLLLGLAAGVAAAIDQERATTPRQIGALRWSALVAPRAIIFGAVVGLVGALGGQLVAALAVGFLAWLGVGVAFGLAHTSGTADSPLDPLTVWRRDRQHGLGTGAMVTAATVVAFGVVDWREVGLAGVLGVALLAGLVHAATFPKTWPAALAFLQLGLARQGPVRMLKFLEDARARQILRTAGPIYQFRHARLQDRLAAEYRQKLTNRHGNGVPVSEP
jgi:hypothetical protein